MTYWLYTYIQKYFIQCAFQTTKKITKNSKVKNYLKKLITFSYLTFVLLNYCCPKEAVCKTEPLNDEQHFPVCHASTICPAPHLWVTSCLFHCYQLLAHSNPCRSGNTGADSPLFLPFHLPRCAFFYFSPLYSLSLLSSADNFSFSLPSFPLRFKTPSISSSYLFIYSFLSKGIDVYRFFLDVPQMRRRKRWSCTF